MKFNFAASGLNLPKILTKLKITTQLHSSYDKTLWIHTWFENKTLSFQEILNILQNSQVDYFLEDEFRLNKSHSKNFPDWIRKQSDWLCEQSRAETTQLDFLCQSNFPLPEPSLCMELKNELDNYASSLVGASCRWERWQCPGAPGFTVQGIAEGPRKPYIRAEIVLQRIARILQKYDVGKYLLIVQLTKNTFHQIGKTSPGIGITSPRRRTRPTRRVRV